MGYCEEEQQIVTKSAVAKVETQSSQSFDPTGVNLPPIRRPDTASYVDSTGVAGSRGHYPHDPSWQGEHQLPPLDAVLAGPYHPYTPNEGGFPPGYRGHSTCDFRSLELMSDRTRELWGFHTCRSVSERVEPSTQRHGPLDVVEDGLQECSIVQMQMTCAWAK